MWGCVCCCLLQLCCSLSGLGPSGFYGVAVLGIVGMSSFVPPPPSPPSAHSHSVAVASAHVHLPTPLYPSSCGASSLKGGIVHADVAYHATTLCLRCTVLGPSWAVSIWPAPSPSVTPLLTTTAHFFSQVVEAPTPHGCIARPVRCMPAYQQAILAPLPTQSTHCSPQAVEALSRQ